MSPIQSASKWALRLGIWLLIALPLTALVPAKSCIGATIDIEVATEPGVSPIAPPAWAKILGQLDMGPKQTGQLRIGQVRIRKIRPGDKPEIIEPSKPTGTRYRLLAILNQRGKLILPGAQFGQHEMARLRDYLLQLQADGVASMSADRDRFGLTQEEFNTIYQVLSRTISFPTESISCPRFLQQFTTGLPIPLEIEPKVNSILQQSPPLEVDLQGMTFGTSLAMLLRPHRLSLIPRKPRGKPPELAILPSSDQQPSWPVGWKPEQAPRQLAPRMYKFLTIEIDRYTLSQALNSMGPRMGIPLWFDRRILEQRQIDPTQISVKLPRGKTYLKRALDRVLVQASLAGEIRVDEADHPFYWITQFGRESPRAE